MNKAVGVFDYPTPASPLLVKKENRKIILFQISLAMSCPDNHKTQILRKKWKSVGPFMDEMLFQMDQSPLKIMYYEKFPSPLKWVSYLFLELLDYKKKKKKTYGIKYKRYPPPLYGWDKAWKQYF